MPWGRGAAAGNRGKPPTTSAIVNKMVKNPTNIQKQPTTTTATKGKESSMLERLRSPAGFNDRPYRCGCCKSHQCIMFLFVFSLILGIAMVALGVTTAGLEKYYFTWIIAGGVVKLIGATLCLLMLWKPSRGYVLAYLTETIMEIVLVGLAMFILLIMVVTVSDHLKWKTKDANEKWLDSANVKNVIGIGAQWMKVKDSALVGITFVPMLAFLVLLVMQVVAIYRFTKYVQDRSEYIARKSAAPIIEPRRPPPPPPRPPPSSYDPRGPPPRRDTTLFNASEFPTTTVQTATATASKGVTVPPAPSSDTMPLRQTWGPSTKKNKDVTPKAGKGSGKWITASTVSVKTNPKTKKDAGASGTEYASVNPPSPSQVEAKKRKQAQAQSKK